MPEDRPVITVQISGEPDVVMAHQRARQVAEALGFDNQDRTRLATAVSEIARNAFEYAGGGRVEFLAGGTPPALTVRVTDSGKGIPDLKHILDGRYQSKTGMGLGMLGARRLMDSFEVRSTDSGTLVTMAKYLPPASPTPDVASLARLGEELARRRTGGMLAEIQEQNQELLQALSNLREREDDLQRLNRELEETNRGVLALYAELDDRAKALQLANETKTRFVSNMSHEFRTPLNAIQSLSRMLLDRLDGELTPEQEKQVLFIRRSAEGLSELVNDLLDIAKVEAGKLDVRPARFRLSELLGGLRGVMRPLAQNPNVILVVEEPAPEVEHLFTDEGKVSQVLRNLVSNALKFTESGEVRVRAAAGALPGTVVLTVSDTGIGIAPEDQARIFEEFAQLDNPIQKRVRGTGLGLPLSRKLAELLGGTLTVRSEAGRGSAFELAIPCVHPSAPSAPAEPEAAAAAPLQAGRAALVIDDDEIARYILRGFLEPEGFTVLEAANGREGIDLARGSRPDVIFLDLVMPEADGFQVLAALKADDALRVVPVVVNTSQSLPAEDRSRLAAAAAILSKGAASREETAGRIRAALDAAGVLHA
ncbi:MAG TPA: ATP-binding protein [Deinococcales bacterium]|nr:ATP-binding protein [Deinococcales bacterium]